MLTPDGRLTITGAANNRYMSIDPVDAKAAGFEVTYSGPARPGDIFGDMRRTDGSLILNTDDYISIVLELSG